MATGAVKGRLCKIRFSSTAVGGGVIFNEVRNWSIEHTLEQLDASSADSSGWDEFIPGQRGFIFRAETVMGVSSTALGSAGVQRDIKNLITTVFTNNARLSAFVVEVNTPPVAGTGNSGQWIWGSTGLLTSGKAGYVTNFRVGGKYDDLQLFEFEVRGSGILKYSSGSS